MSPHQLTVSVPTNSPISILADSHPHLNVEATPIGDRLVIGCFGWKEELEEVERGLPEEAGYRSVAKDGDSLILVALTPEWEKELLLCLDRADLLLLPPLMYESGRVRLSAIGFHGSVDLTRIIPGSRLISKRSMRPEELRDRLSMSGLVPKLTRQQGRSVLAALDAGYYESPRRVTTGEVAEGMGISRSTFEEHLKGAESRIISSAEPLVRSQLAEMDGDASGAKELELYARYSSDLGLFVNMALRSGRLVTVDLSEEPPEGAHEQDHPYLARILSHIATGEDGLQDIPLDLEVTPFEMQVLETLRSIPPGEMRTYGDVARSLGRPNSSRAIGNACAKNPVLVVVPCHRVVPSSGGLGNYAGAGGAETKRKLLEKEGAFKKKKRKL